MNMEELSQLIERVEIEGGEYTGEMCTSTQYEVTGENKRAANCDQATGKFRLPSCGFRTIFDVPYESTDALGRPTGLHSLKLCAVDDMVGHMPRFK